MWDFTSVVKYMLDEYITTVVCLEQVYASALCTHGGTCHTLSVSYTPNIHLQ